MTWFDYAVLTVCGLSMLWSLLRGFVREIVSIVGWVAGFVLAMIFTQTVSAMIPASLGPVLSGLIAFISILLAAWVLAGFVGLLLAKLVQAAGLGWTDRLLGMVLGLVRGVVVVLVIVIMAGLTPLPREPFWRSAILSGPLETAVVAIKPMLPDGFAQKIRYR